MFAAYQFSDDDDDDGNIGNYCAVFVGGEGDNVDGDDGDLRQLALYNFFDHHHWRNVGLFFDSLPSRFRELFLSSCCHCCCFGQASLSHHRSRLLCQALLDAHLLVCLPFVDLFEELHHLDDEDEDEDQADEHLNGHRI